MKSGRVSAVKSQNCLHVLIIFLMMFVFMHRHTEMLSLILLKLNHQSFSSLTGSDPSLINQSFLLQTYISGSAVFPAGSTRRNWKLSAVTSTSAGRTNSTARWSTSR